eukprot:5281614-Pleurochrysis_carterae.AAC.1
MLERTKRTHPYPTRANGARTHARRSRLHVRTQGKQPCKYSTACARTHIHANAHVRVDELAHARSLLDTDAEQL